MTEKPVAPSLLHILAISSKRSDSFKKILSAQVSNAESAAFDSSPDFSFNDKLSVNRQAVFSKDR